MKWINRGKACTTWKPCHPSSNCICMCTEGWLWRTHIKRGHYAGAVCCQSDDLYGLIYGKLHNIELYVNLLYALWQGRLQRNDDKEEKPHGSMFTESSRGIPTCAFKPKFYLCSLWILTREASVVQKWINCTFPNKVFIFVSLYLYFWAEWKWSTVARFEWEDMKRFREKKNLRKSRSSKWDSEQLLQMKLIFTILFPKKKICKYLIKIV